MGAGRRGVAIARAQRRDAADRRAEVAPLDRRRDRARFERPADPRCARRDRRPTGRRCCAATTATVAAVRFASRDADPGRDRPLPARRHSCPSGPPDRHATIDACVTPHRARGLDQHRAEPHEPTADDVDSSGTARALVRLRRRRDRQDARADRSCRRRRSSRTQDRRVDVDRRVVVGSTNHSPAVGASDRNSRSIDAADVPTAGMLLRAHAVDRRRSPPANGRSKYTSRRNPGDAACRPSTSMDLPVVVVGSTTCAGWAHKMSLSVCGAIHAARGARSHIVAGLAARERAAASRCSPRSVVENPLDAERIGRGFDELVGMRRSVASSTAAGASTQAARSRSSHDSAMIGICARVRRPGALAIGAC